MKNSGGAATTYRSIDVNGTCVRQPGGFIDTYAKAISDGVVSFVRSGGQ